MIDVYGLDENKNLVFKDYFRLKIKGLIVPLKNYTYWPDIGIDSSLWFTENKTSLQSFQNYLSEYLKNYKIPVKNIDITEGADSITSLNITINLKNNTQEVLNNAV